MPMNASVCLPLACHVAVSRGHHVEVAGMVPHKSKGNRHQTGMCAVVRTCHTMYEGKQWSSNVHVTCCTA
jgi:hypothetical protein